MITNWRQVYGVNFFIYFLYFLKISIKGVFGLQPRMRGRGWNRGNYPNNNNGNPANMSGPVRPPEEEWDPEYTPKSRKYYQVHTVYTHLI